MNPIDALLDRPFDSEFPMRLTLAMLHVAWLGAVAAALSAGVAGGLRLHSARLRYALQVAVLGALAISLPAAYLLVEVPPAAATLSRISAVDSSAASPAADTSIPTVTGNGRGPASRGDTDLAIGATETPAPLASHASPAGPAAPSPERSRLGVILNAAAPYVAIAYFAGVLLMSLRLLLALRGGRRLRAGARAVVEPELLAMVCRQAQRVGMRVAPFVGWCDRVTTPIVVGIVAPAILLPASLAGGLSHEQLAALITHELAHIRRFDLLVNLLQRVVEAILFFHPAVWFVSRQISREREHCCDDCVVSAGWPGVAYAEALLRMAELCAARGTVRQVAALGAAGETPSDFKHRILRLLEADPRPSLRLGPLGVLTLGLLLAGTLSGTAWVRTAMVAHAGQVRDRQSLENDLSERTEKQLAAIADPAGQEKPAGVATAAREEDPLDGDAAVRLGSVRYRVGGRIRGMTFGPNDQTIVATTGNDFNVIDFATGNRLRTIGSLKEDYGAIDQLRASANRRTAVSLGEKFAGTKWTTLLTRWNLLTGESASVTLAPMPDPEPKKIAGDDNHEILLFAAGGGVLGITPDAATAFTGSTSGLLQAWDSTTGKELARLQLGRSAEGIRSLAVSPDGELLAASSLASLHLWKWRTEKTAVVIPVGYPLQSLAFSPDGRFLAEGPADRGVITVLDVRTRAVKQRLRDPGGSISTVWSLAFSPDGKSLAAPHLINQAGGRMVPRLNVWNPETGQLQRSLQTDRTHPHDLTWSQNGRWLAAASFARVEVWDMTTGKPVDDRSPNHGGIVLGVRLSRDGRTAVTAGDDTLRVWDATTGALRHVLRHEQWLCGLALSADGRHIASSSGDDTVCLWDATTGKETHRLPGSGKRGGAGTKILAFSADGATLVSWGDNDARLRVVDTATGKIVSNRRVAPPVDPNGPQFGNDGVLVNDAVLSADAKQVALALGPRVSIWDVATGTRKTTLAPPGEWTTSVAFSPDGTRLATSGDVGVAGEMRNTVCLWDVASGRELSTIQLPDTSGQIAFSPDGRLLAAVAKVSAMPLRLLDAGDGTVLRTFEGIRAEPQSLGFSGDTKRLAAGFPDGSTLIWDLEHRPK